MRKIGGERGIVPKEDGREGEGLKGDLWMVGLDLMKEGGTTL